MRRVLKWQIPVDDQWYEIGAGPVALVDIQPSTYRDHPSGLVTVWTVEEQDPNFPMRMRRVCIFGTGHEVPNYGEHLGSCQDGPLVWHLFGARMVPG